MLCGKIILLRTSLPNRLHNLLLHLSYHLFKAFALLWLAEDGLADVYLLTYLD
jgi:hypothetical protein